MDFYIAITLILVINIAVAVARVTKFKWLRWLLWGVAILMLLPALMFGLRALTV
ncbi:hypothetical protein [Mechercharimyces sp. CAU 1602]|uniref:hypothetical protein n=1 Tax=Mechercharimyces sp. CAU 1602 TaxID=2973933 RepID=UPI002162D4F9|nr:hypothetical protein [Mechercharimyces sp. CAU 1602]MCS1350971.1 hypothetical protein [Mechercharimyces sp. CAU 1602]